MTERFFAGVVTRYGRDSIQYEMAGGRPRGTRRKTGGTTPQPPMLTTTIIDHNDTVPKSKVAQNGKSK
jgi:hypothetical protein